MFVFLGKVANWLRDVAAQFPQSTTALLTLVATVVSHFGFHVTATQLASIDSAVLLVISILTHQAAKVSAKGAKHAAK